MGMVSLTSQFYSMQRCQCALSYYFSFWDVASKFSPLYAEISNGSNNCLL